MDTQIGNPNAVYLLLVALLTLALGGFATWTRVRGAKKFATVNLASRMLPPNHSWRHWLSTLLVALALALVTLALVDIRWGKTTREVPQKGIEVMFALDVSRSMLAEDVSPNRLGRAKQQIKDMLEEMTGDRVGLVIFAGDTHQSVPLTSHYDDFRQILDSVGPHSLNRGGSRLGDAIRTAADGFISKTNDHKAIVIFTDGEDQESDPIEAATTAYTDQGIRIFTVGLGDIEQGALVPVDREDGSGRGASIYLRYKGETVRSKMNGEILSKIATETDGAYIPAGTRRVDMANVYHGYIANVRQTEFETAKIDTYIPRFQWFAAPALLLLVIEIFVSTRRAKATVAVAATKKVSRVAGRAAAVLVVILATQTSHATESAKIAAAKKINTANQLVRDGQLDEAITKYEEISTSHDTQDLLTYDLGVARYRAGEIDGAADLFATVAGSEDSAIAARGRYNLGNCRYAAAIQLAETEKLAAIEKLREAIDHYRGSLASDPHHVDARANIELAAKLIRQLQDQQKQQQDQRQPNEKQQGDQKQQSGDDAAGDDSQQDKNANQGEQDSTEQHQSSENQQDESSSNSESNEMSDSQQNSRDQESSSPGKENESQPNESSSQPKEATGEGSESKEPASSDDPNAAQQDDSDADSEQPTSSGELSAADSSKPDGESSSSGVTAADEMPPGTLTRDEAMKMLQAVRDRDMLRRMQQERRLQSQRFNVERDW